MPLQRALGGAGYGFENAVLALDLSKQLGELGLGKTMLGNELGNVVFDVLPSCVIRVGGPETATAWSFPTETLAA